MNNLHWEQLHGSRYCITRSNKLIVVLSKPPIFKDTSGVDKGRRTGPGFGEVGTWGWLVDEVVRGDGSCGGGAVPDAVPHAPRQECIVDADDKSHMRAGESVCLDALAGGKHRGGSGLGQRPTYSRAEKYCGRRMDLAEPNFEASAEPVNRHVPCNHLSGG
jgi:hypothetical protein